LVRVKTSACLMSPRRNSVTSSDDFNSCGTGYTACVMPVGVVCPA
jgi:hypothetical protein